MPTIPTSTKCAQLGCKEYRSKLNTYCIEHGGLDSSNNYDKKQKDKEYASPLWKQTRKTMLSKHPLCQSCLTVGRVTEAKHIDHLFAWKLIGREAFHNNIFQSLCVHCHSYKTSLESKGIFRFFSNPVQDYRLSDYKAIVYGTLEKLKYSDE